MKMEGSTNTAVRARMLVPGGWYGALIGWASFSKDCGNDEHVLGGFGRERCAGWMGQVGFVGM
jgi:hypothetical protein